MFIENRNVGLGGPFAESSGNSGPLDRITEEVREHYRQFAGQCGDDPARWGWWLTELRERFPLNRWGRNVNEAADELLQESARQLKDDVPVFPRKKR